MHRWSAFIAALALAGNAATAASFEGELDLAEIHLDRDHNLFVDGTFSYGGETSRVVAKLATGGSVGQQLDEVEGQLLYSHALSDKVAVLAGVRHEFRPHPHWTYGVLGIEADAAEGLALESYAFLSEEGDLTGEAKAIYDLSLAKRWTLQPRVGLGWAAQAVPAQGLASGPTEAGLGLGLRFELTQAFAPYVGISHERLLGDTADIARLVGDDVKETHLVVGFSSSF